ncbi:HNH endonuclease [Pseudomonadota bacterium]
MSTYLLTWKPTEWDYEKLKERLDEFESGNTIQRWSCGTTKSIAIGSRVFLMKQGKGARGIFGSGVVEQVPFQDEHYNEEKRKQGKLANYVLVDFNKFYDPLGGIKINDSELFTLHKSIWNSQGSGKKILPSVAAELETIWQQRTGADLFAFPDEINDTETHIEGAKKTVTVNAYERDSEAREKCIKHWKLNCYVCGFHFEMAYGNLGKGFIHVHHLKPLSEIGHEYEVDPIEDLRPVCPNCHAMLHRKRPALSIEELKSIVNIYRIEKRS